MKTLLLTALSVIIIMIMSWVPQEDPYVKYETAIVESKILTDSALLYLKQLHEHNDSLLDQYFPKVEIAK